MYRMLINNFPNLAVFVVDKDLKVLLADGHDLETNGYAIKELVGKTLYESIPGSTELLNYYEQVFKGSANVFEIESRGDIFQIEARPVRDTNGEIIAATVISQNVTERSKLEQLLMKTTFEDQDKEKQLISLNLHDGLGQQLSGLKLMLENIQPATNDIAQKEILDDAKVTINKILKRIRAISHELMPSGIADFGLETALEDLCAEQEKKSHLKINFKVYGKNLKLSNNIGVGLYRITQELLQWAGKNPKNAEVQVQLTRHEKSVVLVIEDGRTLKHPDMNYFENTREFYNITSRTRALNGRLAVEAKPSKGTLVSVEIPVR
jgi:PAS domain S-box-containing protein